jgi:hypothetical protein
MKKQLLATAAVVLATAGVAYSAGGANASGDDKNAQGRSTSRASALAATTSGIVKCDGGAAINLRTRIGNSPFIFPETAVPDEDRAVPGASLALTGPSSGTDTYLVTFSAESQITGGDAQDWMGLELKLDGVNVNPFTAVGDVLAFTGEPSWNHNATQFCAKVGPGAHQFQVYSNLHDTGADHSLSGWLDDYTVGFQRFN